MDNDKLDKRTRQALERAGSDYAAEDMPEYGTRMTEEESEIVTKTQEELLTESHGSLTLFAEDEPLRLKIADCLAKRYRFFHPMLEFIEVFWLRDGFDIICGNPPWIKLEFDEQGILSEKYPEVAIRKVSAPEARKMRDRMFLHIPSSEGLYRSEEIETACSSTFMNAYCNYPLLVGQQTNLYKCVLENGFTMMSNKGFMGLLHPETIYDDPKGQPLRKEVYPRLKYHFQYENELNLFTGTNDNGRMRFGTNVYHGMKDIISFVNMNNVFHPSTIDGCFVHNGMGLCGGIKDENGNWNTTAHKERLVYFSEKELRVLSDAFEDGADWTTVKMSSIHAQPIINVLKTLSLSPKHVRDYSYSLTEGLHEANAVDDGIMTRLTCDVNIDNYEMIYSGPHFYVANPCYKTPRNNCNSNGDYDTINLSSIEDAYVQKSNYKRLLCKEDFINLINGFPVGKNADGNVRYDHWIDYYKIAYRKMQNQQGERTLTTCILPAKSSHINGAVTITFQDKSELLELASLSCSLVLDFYMKTIGAQNINRTRVNSFPLGIADKYKPALFARTLLLNCLTTAYADLWQETWDGAYKSENWSKMDCRLKPFDQLHNGWAWDIPLRNYFERRQALVEIDVIAAIALGLSIQDLEMIYTIQFPVLQQNENDTWYDAEGKIVFTCSKGLTGVGLDRKRNNKTGMLGWEDIRGEQIDENTYAGTAPTHTHTIDPTKSELYGGQQQTFVAPYTRCDRIADYRTAWAHFEKLFNK